jgi:hypothetical protein
MLPLRLRLFNDLIIIHLIDLDMLVRVAEIIFIPVALPERQPVEARVGVFELFLLINFLSLAPSLLQLFVVLFIRRSRLLLLCLVILIKDFLLSAYEVVF